MTAQEIQHGLVDLATRKRQARDRLAGILYPGDVVYVTEHTRSRTGLTATFSVYAVDDEATLVDVTEDVATVLGLGARRQADASTSRVVVNLNPVTAGREIADGLADVLGYELEWRAL